jgi:hypothetical protein
LSLDNDGYLDPLYEFIEKSQSLQSICLYHVRDFRVVGRLVLALVSVYKSLLFVNVFWNQSLQRRSKASSNAQHRTFSH